VRTGALGSMKVAFATLTALPVKVEWDSASARGAVGYYPLVGLALGGVAWLVDAGFVYVGGRRAGALLLASLAVAVWAGCTQLLHWDGLADVADGYFADSPEERLRIMRDSHVGAFGVAAVSMLLLLEVSALAAVISRWSLAPLVFVPVFGRLAASFGGWFGRPARPEGLGASITGSATVGSVAPAVLCVALTGAVLAWMNPVAGTAVVVVGVVGAAIVPHLLSRRFGGVTGDVLGASILLVETLTAVVAAWLW